MTIRRSSIAITGVGLAALVLAGCSSPETTSAQTDCPLTVSDMWVKESSLDLAAAFGTISNGAAETDRLVSATAEGIPRVELHTTVDGAMSQVDGFDVPAGGDLVLQSGADHIMFLDLTEKLAPGDTVAMSLQFGSGCTLAVEAPVRPFSMGDGDMQMDPDDAMDADDMADHSMDAESDQDS